MIIIAAEVIQHGTIRRKIFPSEFSASEYSRQATIGQVKESVVDFLTDVLSDAELSAEIKNISIRGFENADKLKAFSDGSGTAEVDLIVASGTGKNVKCSVFVPLYHGEMYRPSVMKVGNNHTAFAPYIIMELLNKQECLKPQVVGIFLNKPGFSREQVISDPNRGPFYMKPDTLGMPYYDPQYHRVPGL